MLLSGSLDFLVPITPLSHWSLSPAVQPYDVEGLIEAGVKTWSDPTGETVIYHDIPVEHGLTWPVYRFIWNGKHGEFSTSMVVIQEGSHGFMMRKWLGTTHGDTQHDLHMVFLPHLRRTPLGKISKTIEPRRKSVFSPTKDGVSMDLCKRRARKTGNHGFYHHRYHRSSKYRASREFSHQIWELGKHSHHMLLVYMWPFVKMSLSGLVDKS